MEILLIIAIVVIIAIISACGSCVGQQREGKRWAQSAGEKLIEFDKKLYEVTEVELKKPIDYNR